MVDAKNNGFEVLSRVELPLWVFDVDNSRVLWANSKALRYWNASSAEELYSRDLKADMSSSVQRRLQQFQQDCVSSGKSYIEDWTLYPNNKPLTTQLSFSRFILADKRDALLVQIVGEALDTKSLTLHSAQALMHTSAMICLFDKSFNIIYSNPSARDVYRSDCHCLRDYLLNKADLDDFEQKIAFNTCWDNEVQVRTRAGIRWHGLTIRTSPDPVTGEVTYLASASDVTERRQLAFQAIQQARTDSLTNLPNRLSFTEETEYRINNSVALPFALIYMDLDRFKLVNDSLGHHIGDKLLQHVADVLCNGLGSMVHSAFRMSGDEFVLLVDRVERAYLNTVIDKIFSSFSKPVLIDGYSLRVSPSLGVSLFPEHGQSTTELMQHADTAMYAAKTAGAGICYFESAMLAASKKRLTLENALADAVSGDQLELYYQPKIACKTHHITGVEALLRWHHPEQGLISPLEFIPVAEETGLIDQIGTWVMRTAMRDQLRMQESGHDIPVAINVSAQQFRNPNFTHSLLACLTETGCKPGNVNLEITESMLIGDDEVTHQLLNNIADLGINFSIDDFGTGYSNLSYLQKLPIQTLKIDRSFVADNENTKLLQIIIEMARSLGLRSVAEGVETRQQASWLENQACDELQGYHYCKPVNIQQFIDWAAKWQCDGEVERLKLPELQAEAA